MGYNYDHYIPAGTQPTSEQIADGLLISNLVLNSTTATPKYVILGNFTLQNPPYSNKPVSITISTEK